MHDLTLDKLCYIETSTNPDPKWVSARSRTDKADVQWRWHPKCSSWNPMWHRDVGISKSADIENCCSQQDIFVYTIYTICSTIFQAILPGVVLFFRNRLAPAKNALFMCGQRNTQCLSTCFNDHDLTTRLPDTCSVSCEPSWWAKVKLACERGMIRCWRCTSIIVTYTLYIIII